MSIMLRISLLLGALFALGIVINSVRKSRIRISDSVFWVISATLLLLFAIIPQLPFFFSRLFLNQQLCSGCCDSPDAYQTVPSVVQHFSPYL